MSFKEVQKRRALTSNVLQLQVNKFVFNRNNQIIMPSNPILAKLNTNGFIEVFNGALKSTGSESLQSIIPKEADLSIKQNNGFSFFLWLYLFKVPKKKDPKEKESEKEKEQMESRNILYVFKKGSSVDKFTPTLGVTDYKKHLIVQLSTSTLKNAMILSNKTIEEAHLYSIGVSFEINYEENNTEICIYIDGKLDTQSKISGEPLHNQGNVIFGKNDYSSKGFKGVMADLIMIPSILNENDITTAHFEGLKNLSDSNGVKIEMNSIFNEIFKRKRLINKYAYYTEKTMYEIENLCLSNSKMLEVVKNYDQEEIINDKREPEKKKNEREEKMKREMKQFLSNEDNRIICNKIEMNSQLINTCFYLANQGEDNLEIERVLNIFFTLQEILLFEVTEEFIIKLAKILYAYLKVGEKERYLKTKKFFINLQKSLDNFEKNEIEEEEENAKYQKKTKGKKNVNNNINFNYLLRRKKEEKFNPLPPLKTRGFGNCITEHENLLLKTQNLRDSIEASQEQNLKYYHSMFRIKDLYDVPKNLPGEDSTFPNVKIIHSENASKSCILSLKKDTTNNQSKIFNDSKDNQLNQSQSSQNSINSITNSSMRDSKYSQTCSNNTIKIKKIRINDKDAETRKKINSLLLDILKGDEYKIKTPEIGMNDNPKKAELMEKNIIKQREEIKKRKEEIEKKKMEEEMSKNKKEEVYVEPPKKVSYSSDPKYPEDWSNGGFELVINHCHDCDKHDKTTRHYEYQFIDKFNEIGEAVKNKFPNSIIIGNLDEGDYYGNFDVYLRNTGLPSIEKGKYFLYTKGYTKKFPTANEIVDKLICLVIMYGTTLNLEKAQINPFKPEPLVRLNITHDFPAEMGETAEKIRQKIFKKNPEFKIDPERTKFFCTNNGCNIEFVQKNNSPKACWYHPGIYQFGSVSCLWPECWTCCEKKWGSKGCKQGEHKGILLEKRIMLCLNHGDLNKKGYPDSVCGTWYTSRSTDGCKYHSGHIQRSKYTCCGQGPDSPGCIEGSHETATYPDEKAKLYFYPKGINNPGLNHDKNQEKLSVPDLIKRCFYFKETMEYPDLKALKEEEIKKQDREEVMVRQCLNVGCNKRFIQKTNTERSCMCHPGRWDFGGTKFNFGFIEEEEIRRELQYEERAKKVQHENILNSKKKKKSRELRLMEVEACYGKWRPHWTCCGGKWNAEPCTPCKHKGPLLSEIKNYYFPHRYPDIRYQFTFKRLVSDRWANYIEQFKYEPKKVRAICKNFIQKKSNISINNIHELLNLLKMKYVMEQEDPSYFLKYRDLCLKTETYNILCNEGEQYIDVNNFLKWWFSDYLTLYNIIHPPEKKKKVELKKEEAKNQ